MNKTFIGKYTFRSLEKAATLFLFGFILMMTGAITMALLGALVMIFKIVETAFTSYLVYTVIVAVALYTITATAVLFFGLKYFAHAAPNEDKYIIGIYIFFIATIMEIVWLFPVTGDLTGISSLPLITSRILAIPVSVRLYKTKAKKGEKQK